MPSSTEIQHSVEALSAEAASLSAIRTDLRRSGPARA